MGAFNFLRQFTSGQRKGIMALFLLIIVFQGIYFVVASYDFTNTTGRSAEEKEWLALQSDIDALKAKKKDGKDVIYPFNPNYISDYKSYTLGMSVEEIDRLQAFRKTGKFINSPEDFQKVTKVSDSLLAKISPYFKFPDWVNNKGKAKDTTADAPAYAKDNKPQYKSGEKRITRIDINSALEEDFVKVYGIGPYYAKQILRRRADLGAFVTMEQMDEFADLSPEAVSGMKKNFLVGVDPAVSKININTASLQQLSHFPYFNRNIAKAIITKRSMNGKINNIDELSKINDFPVDKLKIISLYLDF